MVVINYRRKFDKKKKKTEQKTVSARLTRAHHNTLDRQTNAIHNSHSDTVPLSAVLVVLQKRWARVFLFAGFQFFQPPTDRRDDTTDGVVML